MADNKQTYLPVVIVHEPTATIITRVATVAEAEHWIEEKKKIDPDGVDAGDYGIDAPSAEHMADIQRTAYIIEYSPGTSKMWHRSASNPHAGFQTEAQALDTIKRSRSVNSLGKKVRYRLVRVVETRTVLQEVA